MIPLDQEQHLGKKAYLLMASRKMTPGLIIVLIAAILLMMSGILGGFLAGILAINGSSPASASALAGTVSSYIVTGLFVVGLIVCLSGIIVARLEYANLSFAFGEFGLRLKRGIIGTTEISIPYRQMQDINIERGVMHRMTGTAKVIIDSGGHEESDEKNETDIILDPIDMPIAGEIRDMMQRKIGVQVVEGEREADREFNAGVVSSTPPNPIS